MKDCDYKLLSTNEIGNVLFCDNCKEMIIGIGTFILKFKEDQTRKFLHALKTTQEEYNSLKNKNSNKIFLKTPVNNLMIALNERELEQSVDLIEFAFLRKEIDEMILA
jgi:hypothetical protein